METSDIDPKLSLDWLIVQFNFRQIQVQLFYIGVIIIVVIVCFIDSLLPLPARTFRLDENTSHEHFVSIPLVNKSIIYKFNRLVQT